jgi:uncharacterized protein YhbP (UPF0306 family)
MELMERAEKLDPELEPYVSPSKFGGAMIHHPLLIELFWQPERSALVNFRYRHKKAKAAEYLKQQQWESYIFIHEKPYRLQALMHCHTAGLHGEEFWKCLGDVWTNSENIWQNLTLWKMLWNQKDQAKMMCMTPEEQGNLNKMSSTLTVWRGVQYKKAVQSLSWTLDKDKAIWFARRYARKTVKPKLLHGTVLKAKVHAYFLGRNEQEIVSDKVTILKIEELT